MKIYNRAILPEGFKANAVYSGIKGSAKSDLALFFSEVPAIAACKFTNNKIQAAPIQVNKRYLQKNREFNAIIVNSGNANAFCGREGVNDACQMTKSLAQYLALKKENVLIASTGIIAKRLPLEKIKQALPELVKGLDVKGADKAKEAILTTDKFPKTITVKCNIGKKVITICGIAKGAGMISPNMATMLVFIFTDADITYEALKSALDIAVEDSFNCITVDGCMSTNDSVMLLANKSAKNDTITKEKHFKQFFKALEAVCIELAKLIVRDGEGATKFISVKVTNAKTHQEAKKIALSIANSNLFKTAMFASSPNCFGRIAAAVGASGVSVKENNLKINYSPLNKKEVDITVSLARGVENAIVYTSDLSCEYIKINAEYN